jgi:hypothetical protein
MRLNNKDPPIVTLSKKFLGPTIVFAILQMFWQGGTSSGKHHTLVIV